MDNDIQLTVRKKITPDPSNRPLERIGKGEEITIRKKWYHLHVLRANECKAFLEGRQKCRTYCPGS